MVIKLSVRYGSVKTIRTKLYYTYINNYLRLNWCCAWPCAIFSIASSIFAEYEQLGQSNWNTLELDSRTSVSFFCLLFLNLFHLIRMPRSSVRIRDVFRFGCSSARVHCGQLNVISCEGCFIQLITSLVVLKSNGGRIEKTGL